MSDIFDDVKLGAIVVPEDDEMQDQCDLNAILLYEHNKDELLQKIPLRTSRYDLEFLLNSIPNKQEVGYWKYALREFIKNYSLNYLKLYTYEGYHELDNLDLESEIKKLFFYVKCILIDLITFNNLQKTIKREELLEFIKKYNCPILLERSLDFMDNESYYRFLNTIFKEVFMPYE